MKIPLSVRTAYSSLKDVYEVLKGRIDRELGGVRPEYWHYSSRLKAEESFAQKLETGRFELEKFDDFFACTLVVRNYNDISSALDFVSQVCTIGSRRPARDDETHKGPDSFPFDDLRIYASYKDDPALPESGVADLLFEIQIKTFLQHAWSIATHDLVYKTDDISWAKSRIAYQIKAVLEHAEISIDEAPRLSSNPQLRKTNEQTRKVLEAVELLRSLWSKSDLPNDVLRLADTVRLLISALKISLDDLGATVREETAKGRGTNLLNLSPYGVLIQSLLYSRPAEMEKLLSKRDSRFKVFVPNEVEIPTAMDVKKLLNIVKV